MADNANDVRWLEASLTVDGELAEAVADVMARCVVNGVVVESGVRYNDAEDEGTPTGPVRVYGYMPVDANLEATRQRLEESLWHLGQIDQRFFGAGNAHIQQAQPLTHIIQARLAGGLAFFVPGVFVGRYQRFELGNSLRREVQTAPDKVLFGDEGVASIP